MQLCIKTVGSKETSGLITTGRGQPVFENASIMSCPSQSLCAPVQPEAKLQSLSQRKQREAKRDMNLHTHTHTHTQSLRVPGSAQVDNK